MSSFSRGMEAITDPRRAYRLAERIANGSLDPSGALTGPPGRVNSDAAGFGQLLASGVNFDSAGFAYDTSTYSAYTCNGSGNASAPRWTKVGARTGNLRLSLGDISNPIYVWIWGTFSWANNGTGADGRVVACFYDSLTGSDSALCRASNIANNRAPSGNTFQQFSYMGFMAIDEDILNGNVGSPTGKQDWNIGLQQQLGGAQQVTTQSASRQSIICFISSYPPDGTGNYTVDTDLD